MRFHRLALGKRFEFEDEVYVKTKRMTAVGEASGRERFIRRSADVRPLPQAPGSAGKHSANALLSLRETEAVLQAFDAFYAHCLRCLDDSAGAAERGQKRFAGGSRRRGSGFWNGCCRRYRAVDRRRWPKALIDRSRFPVAAAGPDNRSAAGRLPA